MTKIGLRGGACKIILCRSVTGLSLPYHESFLKMYDAYSSVYGIDEKIILHTVYRCLWILSQRQSALGEGQLFRKDARIPGVKYIDLVIVWEAIRTQLVLPTDAIFGVNCSINTDKYGLHSRQ